MSHDIRTFDAYQRETLEPSLPTPTVSTQAIGRCSCEILAILYQAESQNRELDHKEHLQLKTILSNTLHHLTDLATELFYPLSELAHHDLEQHRGARR